MTKTFRQQYAREYQTWCDLRRRCNNPKCTSYRYYGARGITVCDRWLESFENFMDDMGPRPEGLTLDRVDNDKGYGPENCEWRTRKEQCNNRGGRRGKRPPLISTTPGVGLYQQHEGGCWRASIQCRVDGKTATNYLGSYATKDEAQEVRTRWANLYNYIRGRDSRQYPYHNTTPTGDTLS